MMDAIKEELANLVFNVEVTVEGDGSEVKARGVDDKPTQNQQLKYTAADENGISSSGSVSRNSPCPCGSGKKFKRCHGAA
jgi:preprotein translocase subunit SecA